MGFTAAGRRVAVVASGRPAASLPLQRFQGIPGRMAMHVRLPQRRRKACAGAFPGGVRKTMAMGTNEYRERGRRFSPENVTVKRGLGEGSFGQVSFASRSHSHPHIIRLVVAAAPPPKPQPRMHWSVRPSLLPPACVSFSCFPLLSLQSRALICSTCHTIRSIVGVLSSPAAVCPHYVM